MIYPGSSLAEWICCCLPGPCKYACFKCTNGILAWLNCNEANATTPTSSHSLLPTHTHRDMQKIASKLRANKLLYNFTQKSHPKTKQHARG